MGVFVLMMCSSPPFLRMFGKIFLCPIHKFCNESDANLLIVGEKSKTFMTHIYQTPGRYFISLFESV